MAELAPALANPLQSTGHTQASQTPCCDRGQSSQHWMIPSFPQTLLTYNLEAFQTCLKVSGLHTPATSRKDQGWYPLSRGISAR